MNESSFGEIGEKGIDKYGCSSDARDVRRITQGWKSRKKEKKGSMSPLS